MTQEFFGPLPPSDFNRDAMQRWLDQQVVSFQKIITGSLQADNILSSSNYVAGVSGWMIDGDGNAEFNDVEVRGDLVSGNWDGTEPLDLSTTDTTATKGYALDSSEGTIQISGNAFLGGELIMIGTDSVFRTAPAGQPHIRLTGEELGTDQTSAVAMRFSLYGLLQADSTVGGVFSFVENRGTDSERRTVIISSGGWLDRTPTGRAHIRLKGETLDGAGEPLVGIGSGSEPVKLLTEGGIQTRDGSQTEPGIFFVSDDDTGFFLPSAGALGVSVNGTEVARFTDTSAVLSFGGTAHMFFTPPQSWSPTPRATTTDPNLGNGSSTGQYSVIGGWCFGWAQFHFGSSGSSAGSGTYFLDFPVPPHPGLSDSTITGQESVLGNGIARDQSNLADNKTDVAVVISDGTMRFHAANPSGTRFAHNRPWSWASDDRFSVRFAYPVDPDWTPS